jgi:hypothetical protein
VFYKLEGLLGMIHMEAYVVHVNMVSREEVSFKLTKETTSTLKGCFDIPFYSDIREK